MPEKQNKLLDFWQELKRRKVIKVLTVYAAAAFVITEASDIVLPRLGLPDWTVTFIIVLLIVGFPISLILSWMFDITPGGIVKTVSGKVRGGGVQESASGNQDGSGRESVVRKKRIGSYELIITVLIVIIGILVYPKILNKDKFSDIREEDGSISIAVMPFGNLTGDTLQNIWQSGFQNLLISSLSVSGELSVREYQSTLAVQKAEVGTQYAGLTPSVATNIAGRLDANTYVIGSFMISQSRIRVNARLVNAEDQEVYKTFQVEGEKEDDVFNMADSLGNLIRNYLEIRQFMDKSEIVNVRWYSETNSSQAFKYTIYGWEAFTEYKLAECREWLLKAVEEDPGYIRAQVSLSLIYGYEGNAKEGRYWCEKAYEKKDGLALEDRLIVDYLYAFYFETPDEQIKYLKQFLELRDMDTFYWYLLGYAYWFKEDYKEAIYPFEKVLEINKNMGLVSRNHSVYKLLGDSYHKLDMHDKEREVYEDGLKIMPENYSAFYYARAICALSTGDSLEAERNIIKYREIKHNIGWLESMVKWGEAVIFLEAGQIDKAISLFRQAIDIDGENRAALNNLAYLLIDNDIDLEEGFRLVQKVLEISPEYFWAFETKALYLYKTGKYNEAYKILNELWENRPFYSHDIYLLKEEVEKAIADGN